MARNLKKEYLRKLQDVKTKNGYVVDLVNYVYNPAYGYDYPSLAKVISEDNESRTVSRVFYFKYYNGSGEYIHETHTEPKEAASTWYVVKDKAENVLEASNRFNLNKLIQYAEQF